MYVSSLTIATDGRFRRKIINDRYLIVKKIGEGQYGKVLLAEDLGGRQQQQQSSNKEYDTPLYHHHHKLVAIKTINRIDRLRLITKTYLSHTTKIKREIQIMKNCSHPNVVRLYVVIDDLKFDKILLVLEYCKFGEIDWKHYSHYYEKYNKPMNGIRLNKILRDVLNGLEYLHDCRKIIHRDLKPSNLLISHDNTIKISDFGVSLILENNANDDKELGKTVGTPAFYAPELCQFVNNRLSMIQNLETSSTSSSVKIDSRIDIWSLGVILYCLMFNELPFNGFNEFELFKKIVEDDLRFPKFCKKSKATEDDMTEITQLKDLIKKILIKDPEKRIDIKGIKNHPFTLHDLRSASDKKKFLKLNSTIIQEQLGSDSASSQNGVGLAHKIKKFFAGNDKTAALPQAPISAPISQSTPTLLSRPPDTKTLQQVDDLLDSYLDSSSEDESYGSVVENIDTDDLLQGLRGDSMEQQQQQYTNSTNEASVNSGLLKLSSFVPHEDENNLKTRPPPLTLLPPAIAYKEDGQNSKSSGPGGLETPTTNTTFMIGEASPSSLKSVFSPARRFKNQNRDSNGSTNSGESGDYRSSKLRSSLSEEDNRKDNVTITSLASPVKKESYNARDFAEPRSFFASGSKATSNNINGNLPSSGSSTHLSQLLQQALEDEEDFAFSKPPSSRYSNGSVISEYGHSRTSSFSGSNANGSGFVGLSRITSSSSLLNLNAYLTDDLLPQSLSGFNMDERQQGRRKLYSDVIPLSKWNQDEESLQCESSDDDDDDDANNTTLVLKDNTLEPPLFNVLTMDQYLDQLE
ncbi:uncharacterized protein KQ657_000305 [Scheffersomyces spartinae]|uniref:Protein kinase domain-containing protein n=1 Tax=Scheffersomyces spartinae TaxID=45513 RepID=A0A9P8AKA8_9ASCO|nr:uncharacterized protein KQ657_000305 [Scheffersomyces spartinae]KAG7196290.1 hypothetical protein KQ657_000305 [Scheffersomyces spartinae]